METNHWQIRVRGTVQGVGFRPTVWRLAERLGLAGEIRNDGDGVLIRLAADEAAVRRLLRDLQVEAPPLAAIDSTELRPLAGGGSYSGFEIVASAATAAHTAVTADATTCPACLQEISDPNERRYRYPFTNCTHCGPRF